MNPLLQYILLKRAKKRLKPKSGDQAILKREIVKELRKSHVEFVHSVKQMVFISIGVFSAGFGLNGFLLPNQFIDGGVTGYRYSLIFH